LTWRALLQLPDRVTLTIAGAPHPRNGVDRTLDSIQSFLSTGTFTGGELEPLSPAVFEAWNGLLEGALAVHDRFSVLEVLARRDFGDDAFVWRVRRRS
jgi:hypothetical protein